MKRKKETGKKSAAIKNRALPTGSSGNNLSAAIQARFKARFLIAMALFPVSSSLSLLLLPFQYSPEYRIQSALIRVWTLGRAATLKIAAAARKYSVLKNPDRV